MSFFGYPNESLLAKAIREAQEREAQKKALLGSLLASQSPYSPVLLTPVKRKVFISYHHANEEEAENFIDEWTVKNKVFTPLALGVNDDDDFIESDDTDYVISQIRKKYLYTTSVTIVLIGSCTHSRRYVDWEIKASLRQEQFSLPNGLIGIVLSTQGGRAHLPPRFQDNWNSELKDCYARYHSAPTTASQLREWIEDAFNARTTRAKHIKNSVEIMKYNAVCKICRVTH